MKCPYCGNTESRVIDSRPADGYSSIRRRRECMNCQKRFTTYETIERVPLVVVKKDGSIQTFDKSKIINSMVRACDKRQVPLVKLQQLADEIELELQNSMADEIRSTVIGELVMSKLKDLDEVAYIRFASVYRQFTDVNTFMEELKNLLKNE